jgi:hypothetical protein
MSIRRARTAPLAVRALLYLAVLVSLAGALGLHPEPGFAAGSSSGSARVWTGAETRAASNNDCPICLSHRPFSLASLSGVVLEPGTCSAALALQEPVAPSLPRPHRHQGRAPPSA